MIEVGSLIKQVKFGHSYMHCWRHKTPIIYRATSQWFAGMDVKPNDGSGSLREKALAGVEATEFFPAWGKARLHAMIANRPDWTLSRQRQWGVPMAFLVHRETGELHPRTPELIETIAQLIEKKGIEAWQHVSVEELIGDEAKDYVKTRTHSTCGSIPAPRTKLCCAAAMPRKAISPPICIWKARTNTAAGSILHC